MNTPTTPKIAFARRGFSPMGERITYTSWDVADDDPWGWLKGWHEDGEIVDFGYRLVHVTVPSRRCRAPLAPSATVAA